MTDVKDTLTDEELEEIEEAKLEAKRGKTKYGSKVESKDE